MTLGCYRITPHTSTHTRLFGYNSVSSDVRLPEFINPVRQQYDFLKNGLSICWAVVVRCHCDRLSCFQSNEAGDVMSWERVFINHHPLRSIFHFNQTFCTLHCCIYTKQNSWGAWRCPHSLHAQDLPLCTCCRSCVNNIGPSDYTATLGVLSLYLGIHGHLFLCFWVLYFQNCPRA